MSAFLIVVKQIKYITIINFSHKNECMYSKIPQPKQFY